MSDQSHNMFNKHLGGYLTPLETNTRTGGGGMAYTFSTIPGRTYRLKTLVSNTTRINNEDNIFYLINGGEEVDGDQCYSYGLAKEGWIDLTFTATEAHATFAIGGEEIAPTDINGSTPSIAISLSRLLFIQYPVMQQINPVAYSYRFGFNGQERETSINSSSYDFGARMYDGRIGRFFKTDPREAEYAWQSTYAYYANSPIVQLDFNGEGGTDDNPKDPTHQKGIVTGKTVKRAFKFSGGVEKYNETMKRIKIEKVEVNAKKAAATTSNNLASDSPTFEEAENYNTYSNSDLPYYKIVNESEFSEEEIINYLLGNFIYGTGKENIYFDENSKFSQSFKSSFSFQQGAFLTYVSRNSDNSSDATLNEELSKEYFKYGMSQQARDLIDNFSFLSSSNFIGSYSVTTVTTDKQVEFYIYNVTSISSGSFGKHFNGVTPKSAVRFKNKKTPYGNISQLIKLVFPIVKM